MIVFVFPVYNEEKNIGALLHNLSRAALSKRWDYRVVLSDDGSSDSTVSIAESMRKDFPLEVVKNPINMGPGSAFDLGFRAALRSSGKGDVIVTMEADNTSDLGVLEDMLEKVRSGCDVALASCYAKNGGVQGTTFFRKLLSQGANFLISMVSGSTGIRTFSSFYRCYSYDVLNRAYERYGDKFITEKGFVCAVEIFLKLKRLGARMEEVSMVLRCDRRKGKSKMKILKTTLSYMKLIFREVFVLWLPKR
ncbi:MAG TPA: glycosyltransferase [Candidatus Omnitrophota bacterium]|nr:glycosyltransferase [Candidatus Omnitrophota bacterium]